MDISRKIYKKEFFLIDINEKILWNKYQEVFLKK